MKLSHKISINICIRLTIPFYNFIKYITVYWNAYKTIELTKIKKKQRIEDNLGLLIQDPGKEIRQTINIVISDKMLIFSILVRSEFIMFEGCKEILFSWWLVLTFWSQLQLT